MAEPHGSQVRLSSSTAMAGLATAAAFTVLTATRTANTVLEKNISAGVEGYWLKKVVRNLGQSRG